MCSVHIQGLQGTPLIRITTEKPMDEVLKCDHSDESYTERYFPVVLFIMLYKVVQAFESLDEILTCHHSNERCQAVLSFGAVNMPLKGGSDI